MDINLHYRDNLDEKIFDELLLVLFDHGAESEGEEHVEELNKEDQDDTKHNSDRYSP